MGNTELFRSKIQKFSFFDLKLIGVYSMLAGIILVKLVPEVLEINIWYFVTAFILCFLRLFYLMFLKK